MFTKPKGVTLTTEQIKEKIKADKLAKKSMQAKFDESVPIKISISGISFPNASLYCCVRHPAATSFSQTPSFCIWLPAKWSELILPLPDQ